ISDTSSTLTGYVVVEAESHEAGARMFEGHPHFTIFPGRSVEIMEILSLYRPALRSASPRARPAAPWRRTMSDIEPREREPDSALAAILRILFERTGTDFSTYRPCTVERRVRNRMIVAGADTFEQYLDKLRRDSAEAVRLLERITIKVSRFYRNRITFDWLRAEVIPGLAAAASGRPLGIWSAGCGFGEE